MKLFHKLKHVEFALDEVCLWLFLDTMTMLTLFKDLISPSILLAFSLCYKVYEPVTIPSELYIFIHPSSRTTILSDSSISWCVTGL